LGRIIMLMDLLPAPCYFYDFRWWEGILSHSFRA
jgi:hypothetical protein